MGSEPGPARFGFVLVNERRRHGDHPIEYPQHVQQPLIQMVVDDLNGTGTCPSTGESAARTTWVMDQILADYRTQQG
jgi:hypothetical protein